MNYPVVEYKFGFASKTSLRRACLDNSVLVLPNILSPLMPGTNPEYFGIIALLFDTGD